MYLDEDDNLDILLSQCGPEDALTKILTDELTEQINKEILNLGVRLLPNLVGILHEESILVNGIGFGKITLAWSLWTLINH